MNTGGHVGRKFATYSQSFGRLSLLGALLLMRFTSGAGTVSGGLLGRWGFGSGVRTLGSVLMA